jgi:tetraacyldisaccharide 4'-kinase
MSLADRLQRAWYEGHPALVLLAPLEALYRRVVIAKRKKFVSGAR